MLRETGTVGRAETEALCGALGWLTLHLGSQGRGWE